MVDLNAIHNVSLGNTEMRVDGGKKILINFFIGKNRYQFAIIQENNRLVPFYVRHFQICPLCATKGMTCRAFDSCMDELVQVIESKIRIQLLFI